MSGERVHAAAWRTALETPLGACSAYDYDDVPAVLPNVYVLVTVSRRFGGVARNSGRRPLQGWRLTTLAVGKTVDEARWAREKVFTALNETRNATLGTTLVEFETETPIERDGDRYSGLTSWTYVTNA